MALQGLALVTGASSGIGYHLAQQLAKDGYDLVVAGKEKDLTVKAAADARSYGVTVREFFGDLSQFNVCMDLWNAVEGTKQPLEIACLNAGLCAVGNFEKTSLARELEVVGVNCASTVHVAKHVVRSMVARNTGRILFTASIVDESRGPGEAVYVASKAFVLAFASALRRELTGTGVCVTTLLPQMVNTDFLHAAGVEDCGPRTDAPMSNPAEVAAVGLDGLFKGEEQIEAVPGEVRSAE